MPNEGLNVCRVCGADTTNSTKTARAERRCSDCYNSNVRGRAARGPRFFTAPVRKPAYLVEAESLEDLRRWEAKRAAQRARDIAAIEEITKRYRGVSGG